MISLTSTLNFSILMLVSPKGSVLSPLLFIFYLSDFLSEVGVKFKFADDSSAIISAFNTDTLHSALQAICHNIEFSCKKWRMVVNGSKTELLLLNCLTDNTDPIFLNGERCKTKQSTKSLGLTIDTNLTYREHTSVTASKAVTTWRLLKSNCSNRWGPSIPTQAYLDKTIIRPQFSYAEPIWAQRNYASVQTVQNRIIRSIMKHSMSPKITAIEVLMGIPPIDIYCSSIEIKFLINAVNKDDLVTATHVKTLTRPSSLSSLLLSKLRKLKELICLILTLGTPSMPSSGITGTADGTVRIMTISSGISFPTCHKKRFFHLYWTETL